MREHATRPAQTHAVVTDRPAKVARDRDSAPGGKTPRVGHDFSRIRIHAAGSPAVQRQLLGGLLPTGLRFLTAAERSIASGVFGSSLNFFRILLSNATGLGGRPYTLFYPVLPIPGFASLYGITVIQIGPAAYDTPGSDPSLLIHELTHSWQSQHHVNPAQYMANSVQSQAGAAISGGTAYCYVPGKSFWQYGAEQIARQVENGEPAIRAHVAGTLLGAPDPQNIIGLMFPRWEVRGAAGVQC